MSLIYKDDDYICLLGTLIFFNGVKVIGDFWIDPQTTPVRHIIMPDSVEEIETNAFRNFRKLVSVRFSKNLKKIGDYAFYGCEKLKNVSLPQGLELIGQKAFEKCFSLKKVHFSKGMIGIDRNAFANCIKLKEVSIDGTFYNILGFSAFEGTPYLHTLRKQGELVIKDNILIDGANCKGEVVVPANVVEVAAGAFRYNQHLTYITIPETVKMVSNSAFEGCCNLRKAVMRHTSGLAENLFRDCISLEEIDFPHTIPEVYPNAFTNTPWLKKQQQAGSMVILDKILVDGKGCKGDVKIANVREIASEAFMENVDITSVVVEDGCEAIHEKAFRGCRMLKRVQLPQKMTELGRFLFSKCENLEQIQIPEGIKIIRFSTFNSCFSLKRVEIPDSVKEIQNYAFDNCFSLNLPGLEQVVKGPNYFNKDEKYKRQTGIVLAPTLQDWSETGYKNREDIVAIVVPEGVTSIGKNFFENCSMKRVVLPDSVTEIDDQAFANCYALEYINMPKNLKRIGKEAFSDTALSEIALPEGFESVSYRCFYNCQSLVRVCLPQSIVAIGKHAFGHCERLISINIPQNCHSIDDAAFMKCSLTSIELPEQTTINSGAFMECEQLKQVKLPSSLVSLEDSIFAHCHKLHEVSLPGNLQKIRRYAFSYCTALTRLELPSSLKTVECNAFEKCILLKKPVFGNKVDVSRDAFGEGFRTRNRALIHKTSITFGILAGFSAFVGFFWIFLPIKTALTVVLVILGVLAVVFLLYLRALGKAFSQG